GRRLAVLPRGARRRVAAERHAPAALRIARGRVALARVPRRRLVEARAVVVARPVLARLPRGALDERARVLALAVLAHLPVRALPRRPARTDALARDAPVARRAHPCVTARRGDAQFGNRAAVGTGVDARRLLAGEPRGALELARAAGIQALVQKAVRPRGAR